MNTVMLPEHALIDALHISPKLSCDDRIAILREVQRLAAAPAIPATPDPKSEAVVGLVSALNAAVDAMEPSGACNGNGVVYQNGVAALAAFKAASEGDRG